MGKLRELHSDLRQGVVPRTGYANYTVRQAAEDWLANGLAGRWAKTIKKNRNMPEPIRYAEANDLVSRSVAMLVDTPKGQDGRPSKSLTVKQPVAVISAAKTLPTMELRPGLKDVRLKVPGDH